MDKESIYRFGLEFVKTIDSKIFDELYNQTRSNHIIVLKLFKDNLLIYLLKDNFVNRYMMLVQYQIVEYMLSIDPELKEAYKLLNDYKDFNSDKDITPETAATQLENLILDFNYSVVPEYKRVYKMLSK